MSDCLAMATTVIANKFKHFTKVQHAEERKTESEGNRGRNSNSSAFFFLDKTQLFHVYILPLNADTFTDYVSERTYIRTLIYNQNKISTHIRCKCIAQNFTQLHSLITVFQRSRFALS